MLQSLFKQPFFSSRGARLITLLYTALVAISYDVLFWNKTYGLNVLIFAAFSVAGCCLLLSARNIKITKWALLFIIPLAAFSIATLFYSNELLSTFSLFAVIVSLLAFGLISSLIPNGQPFRILSIPFLRQPDQPFEEWGAMYRDLLRPSETDSKPIYRQIVWGLLIAVPLLAIFTALFASADAVFSGWIANITHFKIDASLLWRIVRTLGVAWFLGGALYVAFRPTYSLATPLKGTKPLEAVVSGIVLLLINLLFLAFISIQLRYLFGDSTFVLQNNLTFAEYARQGFFQLVAVMSLSTLLILAANRSYSHHGRPVWLAALKLLLLSQVVVIGISALKRMHLYQEAYGFTVLRLYVEWFIYFLFIAAAVIAMAVMVRKISFARLVHALLALSILAVVEVSLANVDGLIAAQNVNRFLKENKSIDTSYLRQLSLDVVPSSLQVLNDSGKLATLDLRDKANLYEIIKQAEEKLVKRTNWREYHTGDAALLNQIAIAKKNPAFNILQAAADKQIDFNKIKNKLLTYENQVLSLCKELGVDGIVFDANSNSCIYTYPDQKIHLFETAGTSNSANQPITTYHYSIYQRFFNNKPAVKLFEQTFVQEAVMSSTTFNYILERNGNVAAINPQTLEAYEYSPHEDNGKIILVKNLLQ